MYHGHYRYHPYRSNDRGYFLDEFKKAKPPTFDGEMKKLKDAKAWLLGMNKFFIIHDYSENMKTRIATFSLKGKADIWWEDVKNVRDIFEEVLLGVKSRDYSGISTYRRGTMKKWKNIFMS